MTTKSFTPIRGKRFRVTELDDCGKVLVTSRQFAGDGFVTVTITPNVEDGTDIQLRNANGVLCVNEKGNPTFSGFGVEMEFCDVNPAVAAIMTNAQEYGDGIGFTVAEGEITGRFALEVWTGVAGIACGEEGDEASGYILLPQIAAGTLGDLSVGGEDAITFKVANASTRGDNGWGVGPYNVAKGSGGTAAKLPTALDPLDHLLLMYTEVSPPAAASEPSVVPGT